MVFDQQASSDEGVLEKVERMITESLCVVADVGADANRSPNPNVMLEVGIARGRGRPILLICRDADKMSSNLKGRDVVQFPDCLQVGTAEYTKLIDFLKGLGSGLLGGRPNRIFNSRSDEYLELLKRINSLPGKEWYVGPELRAFFRPPATEERWLRDVREVSGRRLKQEQALRAERRRAFEDNLSTHGCTDIYPLEALHLAQWRGMTLSEEDRRGFLLRAIELLQGYPYYDLVLVEKDDREKYWIKDSPLGRLLIFEGWGYVDIRKDKETGGLVTADQSMVESFLVEAHKLVERGLYSREEVLQLLLARVK